MTKEMRMNNLSQKSESVAHRESRFFLGVVCVVILLCIISCALILLIPSQSTSVDTVYRGF